MALFRLSGYTGEAEILGNLKTVQYTEDSLIIGDLTLDEANTLLSIMSTGKLKGIAPGNAERAAMREILSRPGVDDEAPAETPQGDAPEEDKPETATAQAPEEKPPPKRRRTRKPKDKPEEKADTEPEEKAESKSNGTSTSADSNGLLADLKDQRKLRDVLGILVEKGFKSQQALLDKCVELKDDVPVLSRCANLDERVPRIASSIGIEE